MNAEQPLISFIYRSQITKIDYFDFSKRSNYHKILQLPHSFKIEIPTNEKPEVVNSILSYIQQGDLIISKEYAFELFDQSQKLFLYKLSQFSQTFISENFNVESVISFVSKQYSNRKDISSFEHFFSKMITTYAQCPLFFEKLPDDFILNIFRLGCGSLTPDDYFNFSVDFYRSRNFNPESLQIFQYIDLRNVSPKPLTDFKNLLQTQGKPFPFYNLVKSVLNEKYKIGNKSSDDIHIHHLKAKLGSLLRTLHQQVTNDDPTDACLLLSTLYKGGNLPEASEEQIFRNFLNIAESSNNPETLREVARRYQKGEGTAPDIKKAMEYYERSSNESVKSKIKLAHLIAKHPGYAKQPREFELVSNAARLYDKKALFTIGNYFKTGHGCKKNNLKAIHFFILAGKAGYENIEETIKPLLYSKNSQTEKEAKNALEASSEKSYQIQDSDDVFDVDPLKLAADSNCVRAISIYSQVLINMRRYEEASRYCKILIELDAREGYSIIGNLLKSQGEFEKAFNLFNKSAGKFNLPETFLQLRVFFKKGWIVNKDLSVANFLIEEAVKLGDEDSCAKLAAKSGNYAELMKLSKTPNSRAKYEYGTALLYGKIDGKQQIKTGLNLIREAADNRYPKACLLYGKFLNEGLSMNSVEYVQKDTILAMKYLERFIKRNAFNTAGKDNRFPKINMIRLNEKTVCIDSFYYKSNENAKYLLTRPDGLIYINSIYMKNLYIGTYLNDSIDMIKSMVYYGDPSFRYKAASILLKPTIFNKTNGNPYGNLQIDQRAIEKAKYEGFNHLRQSCDGQSLCGMFRYAYYLLLEKDDIDDNLKNIFHNISVDGIINPKKKYYYEAMNLFLKAGLAGLDVSLYFYAVTAITFPDMIDEGLSYLKYLALDRQHALSKTALGIYYYEKGIYDKALGYLKENAYNKDRAAEHYYGRMLMFGQGIKEDKSLALNFLRMSADKGFKMSQVMLINLLVNFKDLIQLRAYIEPMVYQESFIMYKYSSLLFNNFFESIPFDVDVTIDMLKTSSLLNDSDGLWKFGTFLRDGFIVAKDEREALSLFQKSSNLGNPSGKVCYANYLVKTKPSKSAAGDTPEMNLDKMKRNRVTAFNLFKQSFESQSISGSWCYANCLMRGIGCKVDQLKALSIFIDLSNRYNDMDAQYQVFKLLMNGVMINRKTLKSQIDPQTGQIVNLFGPTTTTTTATNNSSNNNNTQQAETTNNQEENSNTNTNDENNNNNNNNDNDNVGDDAAAVVEEEEEDSFVFVRHQKKAFEYLITAANNGHSTAQCRLGEYLISGLFFKKKDWNGAMHYFKLSAEKGNHRGINNYVKCLIEGRGGFQKDINTAVSFLEKLCANHKTLNGNSEFMYGSILIDNMNKIEEGKKFIMRSALELGNSDGLWKLGDLFMNGIGFEKNYKKAKEYFTQSKEKGNKTGLYKLAQIILHDYKNDLIKLITRSQQSIISHNINEVNAGEIDDSPVFLSDFEAQEIKEGFELLQKAANLQQSDAQLGQAYLAYYGVRITNSKNEDVVFIKKDIPSAVNTFQVVADRDNNAEAMFMFGTLTNDFNYIARSARLKNDKARIAYGKMCFGMNEQKESTTLSATSSSLNIETIDKNEKLAVYYFKLIADQGNAEAQYLFGLCLLKGQGIEKDETRAMKYFKMSAEQGFADAQYEYGSMLIQPDVCFGNPQKKEEGIRHLKEANLKGNNNALYELSMIENNGQMLLEAAKKGSKKAIAKCASVLYSINNPFSESDSDVFDIDINISMKDSFAFLEEAAEFDPQSAFYYGMCLRNGIVVEKDPQRAFDYIKKSYDSGFKKKAAAVLGLYYLGKNIDSDNEADFIEKNTNKAFALFNESFDSNDSFGTNCFGYCFYKGIEGSVSFAGPKNDESSMNSSMMKNAVHYFKVANDNNDPSGINNYAVSMFQGNSVDGSPKLSISYFVRAAERGCYAAVVNLRKIYSPDCPYPKDLIPNMEMSKIEELERKCIEAREANIFRVELAIRI